jgi:hypothetical protein
MRDDMPDPVAASTAMFPPPSIILNPEHRSGTSSPRGGILRAGRTGLEEVRIPERMSTEMMVLQRKERDLEGRLQALLDKQSEGLMAGLGGSQEPRMEQEDDEVSSPMNAESPPYNRPAARRQPPDLTRTRHQIASTIKSLASLKSQYESFTTLDLDSTQSIISQLDTWSLKRDGLQSEITGIKNNTATSESKSIASLKSRAHNLQDQIVAQEQALLRMKKEHNRIVGEISELENRVQSRLTSYVESLRLVEGEVGEFLKNPPNDPYVPKSRGASRAGSQVRTPASTSAEVSPSSVRSPTSPRGMLSPTSRPTKVTFLSLPANRRTLPMARAHFMSTAKSLESHARTIRREKRALEQGGQVWKDCIARIESFERKLKSELASLGSNAVSSDSEREERLKGLLNNMDTVIEALEGNLDLAQKRNWNLLVQCIGAELEAFKQGRKLFAHTFGLDANDSKAENASGGGNTLLDLESKDGARHGSEDEDNEKPDPFPPFPDDSLADEVPPQLLLSTPKPTRSTHSKTNSLSRIGRMHRSVPSKTLLEDRFMGRRKSDVNVEAHADDEDDGPSPDLMVERG